MPEHEEEAGSETEKDDSDEDDDDGEAIEANSDEDDDEAEAEQEGAGTWRKLHSQTAKGGSNIRSEGTQQWHHRYYGHLVHIVRHAR